MRGKIAIIIVLIVLGVLGFVAFDFIKLDNTVDPENSFTSPIVKKADEIKENFKFGDTVEQPQYDTNLANGNELNILLLGIDRRSKAELGYRTDIMILLTVDKENNKAVLTSIPRDLWYGGGRLNAYYINTGFEGMQNAFEEITGKRPDRFVLTDFEDFSWVVDAMGGVPVDVEISFTDSSYPVDATKGYQTVSFTKGQELMTGERALIFARSRKGDFDNGDWGRMKRQHLLLKGMLTSFTQPKSFVCAEANSVLTEGSCETRVDKDVIANIFRTVTTNKMDTNLNVSDLEYLWDFYKDRFDYEIESLLMDYDYVFTPPADQYGGAWVLAPIGGSYSEFQNAIQDKLNPSIEVEPSIETDL